MLSPWRWFVCPGFNAKKKQQAYLKKQMYVKCCGAPPGCDHSILVKTPNA